MTIDSTLYNNPEQPKSQLLVNEDEQSNTTKLTRQEAIENVNAIRDELQAKGKNPQEIFKNKKYQKARAELDTLVKEFQAANSVVNDSNNQFKPPTPGGGRTWKSSDGKYEFETEGAFIDYERILAKEKSEAAAEKALTARSTNFTC